MMTQPMLFPEIAASPATFDGETFDPALDGQRLHSEQKAVEELLADLQWHTIPQIALQLRKRGLTCQEAGISARIRDLRKERFGGFIVLRRRAGRGGLFEYRMTGETQ